MKSPIDIVRGRIVDIDKHGIVTIKARYDDWPMPTSETRMRRLMKR